MFGYDITIKEFLGYLLLFYILLDTILYIINISINTGPGGCASSDWFSGMFYLNISKKPIECEVNQFDDDAVNTTGKWREYAARTSDGELKQCLYERDIDRLVQDIKTNYVVEGYTAVELFAYIIIPVITIESLGFWLLSTRASKAEWTFWIMVVTIIYTGLTTLVKETI